MTRTQIINHLINCYHFTRYLEIGVNRPEDNFDFIRCQFKIGVDPNGRTSFTGTSDDFFNINTTMFDIVFIDGLHEEPQVTRDINNSLQWLSPTGIIVTHDSLPVSEKHQSEHYIPGNTEGNIWAGTVWKSLARLRMSKTNLELRVVDTDWGCGILRRGPSNLYTQGLGEQLDYDFYLRHREKMFNIITPQQFLQVYKTS